MSQKQSNFFDDLNERITNCEKCSRLRVYCQGIAEEKKKAYRDQTYWGKPIPSFGDPHAQLIIIGLAPAAHGANRTGRMFTGDRSGEWLYRALHEAGFANQPTSLSAQDGLQLKNAYITASVRCAPPGNKPLPDESENCAPYLREELENLTRKKVILVLGQIALNAVWPFLKEEKLKKPKFGHAVKLKLTNGQLLLLSYHPSQQNTFTGKLTKPMFDRVFMLAKEYIQHPSKSP